MRRLLVMSLVLALLAPLAVLSQEIKHSTTATAGPPRINAAAWNAPLVVTGGVDGQAFVRDSTATYGWRFGAVAATGGGTGFTGYVIGDLLYASATTVLSRLADVADGNVLRSGGIGVAPLWGKVRLEGSPTDVTGTLPVGSGGTGHVNYVLGDLLYADSATTLGRLADVATGNVVISGGIGAAPAYGKVGLTTHVSGTLAPANGGTGLASYAVGDLLYASGATTLAALPDVAAGSHLRSGGVTTAPGWSTTTWPNTATTGDVLYASAANTYANLTGVATGNALLSGGVATAPSWGKVGLTTHVTDILPGANGGTANGFFAVSGPTTSLKTFTFPDASATVLTTNAAVTVAQGGTGVGTLALNGVLYGNGTGVVLVTTQGAANTILTANAGAPSFSASPVIGTRVTIGTSEATVLSTYALGAFNAGGAYLLTRDTTNDVETLHGADIAGGQLGTLTNHALLFRVNNVNRMTLGAAGGLQLGAPTGGDGGAGTLNVATGLYANGNPGLSVTRTVRDAAGTGTCTITFTFGLHTSGTC